MIEEELDKKQYHLYLLVKKKEIEFHRKYKNFYEKFLQNEKKIDEFYKHLFRVDEKNLLDEEIEIKKDVKELH